MANFFIKRPIFAIVVALVITIAGALCIFSLPIDRYPKITPPQVSVHATYPGADSEVVAQTVAEVIEKNVVGAEGFDNMSSTSNSNGSYSLSVQFLTGTEAPADADGSDATAPGCLHIYPRISDIQRIRRSYSG